MRELLCLRRVDAAVTVSDLVAVACSLLPKNR